MSPPPHKTVKQTKARHRKSRHGCFQCKALRTKCDERKPSCTRCETRGVSCSGYSSNIRWSYKHEVQQQQSNNEPKTATRAVATVDNNHQSMILESGSAASDLQSPVFSTGDHQDGHDAPMTIFSDDQSIVPMLGQWNFSDHLDTQLLESNSVFYNFEDAALDAFPLQCEGPTCPVSETPQDSNPISTGDEVSCALRDGPDNDDSGDNASCSQVVTVPESSRLRGISDVSSSLSTYFFQDVLPRYCTWDSNSNSMRIMIQAMWQSSRSLHHTMQSMAASCLSNELPHFAKIAVQERLLALQSVGETPMREDRLLTSFLLGHTSCWVNPNDLVPNQFKEFWATLESYTCSAGTTSVVSFVQEALEYWTMILSFIADTENLGNSATGLPPASRPLPLNSIITPNPFSGITRGAVRIFTDTGRLIYKLRKGLPNLRFLREADVDFLRETLKEAHQLERRILGYNPLDTPTIVVLGDPYTMSEHFQILDEAFWYTSLLQLYRVFPDLLIQRYRPWNPQDILKPQAASHVPSQDETDEWLRKLALHILNMLQGIPLDSRTRSIQAPILVALSSELRHNPPNASQSDSPSESGSLRSMSPSAISHSIEIARARRYVMSRLSGYWHVLPLQKIKKYHILVKHIWAALDAGVQDVYWADMLQDAQLRTIMG